MLTCELVILNTHFLQRITKTGLSLAVKDLAAEQIRFPRGYEHGVVTAVSEGISWAVQPGRFLPRRVTVSRLELWLSYSPEREGHSLSPTRLPLTFAQTPEVQTLMFEITHIHTHFIIPLGNLRSFETCVSRVVCFRGCFTFVPCLFREWLLGIKHSVLNILYLQLTFQGLF